MDWSQLRTIIWLRWRLTRNQWSRGGQLNAVLTMIVAVALLVLGVASGIAGVLVGFFVLAEASSLRLLLAWDAFIGGFLFAWMIGLVSEIQRSETIDISRMLHLPISLKDIFFVNYLASHLTLSIILFLPLVLGLCLGLLLRGQWLMIWMFPLVLGLVFMITAWTYCLRGWLVTLMVNKRRRRAIIAGITFGFILISQLPNLLGNILHNREPHRVTTTESTQNDKQTIPAENNKRQTLPSELLMAHKVIPFLWVANGAMSLAGGNILPAILGTAGGFLLGGLGLRRAYRSTIRFYTGQTVHKKTAHKPKAKKIITRKNFLERKLPGVSDEAAALALGFFRSLTRAAEVKMMLATNLFIFLIFGVSILMRRSADLSDTFKPFIATGAVMFTFFGMSQLMFNLFGSDRNGFRSLVLSPVPRKYILLGKNLTFLPVAICIGLILLTIVRFAANVSLVIILAAILQLIAAFLLLSIAGNLVSVLVPYRVAPGSMKRTKTSTVTTLMLIMSRLLFPTMMLPIFLPPGFGLLFFRSDWFAAALMNIFLSAILLALLFFFYQLSLVPLGNLLQQQEKKILDVVTKEVE